MPEQPQQSSSWTRHCVAMSVMPPPPYSSGSMYDVMPSSAALCQISQGISVSASSTASEMGRISFSANSRQSAWMSRCSRGEVEELGLKHVSILPERGQRLSVSRLRARDRRTAKRSVTTR